MSHPPWCLRALRDLGRTVSLAFLLLTTVHAASPWHAEITPDEKDNFTKAAFSLWLDDSASAPIALLVIAPGWNGDGRGAVNDAHWRAFAREQHLGLVGVCLQSDEHDEQTPPYHVATRGSGKALLTAIDHLASASKHPELAHAPLLFWGHSAGGQFGYGMVCFAPDRVIAFASIKGGVYLSTPVADTLLVPGLFIVGEQDEVIRAMNITWLFEAGRAKRAPWCLAFEPQEGHGLGRTQELVMPFFRAVLSRRVSSHKPGLTPIEASKDWFGLRSTLEITQGQPPSPNLLPRTVWLPDESSAKAWREFSQER